MPLSGMKSRFFLLSESSSLSVEISGTYGTTSVSDPDSFSPVPAI
jgi:hypothetical protein